MTKGPIPANEEKRLEVLRQYRVLDTAAEQVFDEITRLAAECCQTPISLLSFIDENRQWFKSNVGLPLTETSRDVAFCAHAILQGDLFEVTDAQVDERFADNPLVTGEPYVRYYAGMPLMTPDGYPLGTLCVVDRVPRELTQEQKDKLRALAQSAVMLLEVRRAKGAA